MSDVTIRELRNEGGRVVGRAAAGETLRITRDGIPVAQIGPLRREAVSTVELQKRRKNLPRVDVHALRRELDEVIDPSL